MQMTDKQFAYLMYLGDLPPQSLREMLYDHVPENMVQIHRGYKRGHMIAKLFDVFLKSEKVGD